MIKVLLVILFFLFLLISPTSILAKPNSFVSIVNPIRGTDFWDLKGQKISDAVLGQIEILKKQTLPATWLIRFDALVDNEIVRSLRPIESYEKGLFLEVTPTWATAANVKYHNSKNWHDAKSAFLTGYEREEREKLIDVAFKKFKEVFGYYPISVGAWWVDSFSLDYMQKKYAILAALIVADQYTTDNYQIWGQYFSTPFYPDKKNALHPAQTVENKIPVVISQWAARDPVNGYGNGVFESTFSVQPNDYIDYHNLDVNYFSKLVDIYTKQQFNSFGSLVVGLENTYDWAKFAQEYEKQINILTDKSRKNEISIVTLGDFSSWYQKAFAQISPPHLIIADDPLGSFKKVVWFMNPYYRAGWFLNSDGSVFRDIRQYIGGEEEICFQKRCDSVNFATFATRVLDEVTYGNKWVIDEGNISNFNIIKSGEKSVISYINEVGKKRIIEFLPRDISIDGNISSIDGVILNAIKQNTKEEKKQDEFKQGSFFWHPISVISKIIRFLFFLLVACLIPGLVLTNKLQEKESFLKQLFLSLIVGFVLLTITFYFSSLLNMRILIFGYVLFFFFMFLKLKMFTLFKIQFSSMEKHNLMAILLIVGGTIFQNIPTFRSGLVYPFGMGFWGPNTHDGIWHISLINQLIKGLPVENPIFAGTVLINYHYFYDLLVATTVFFTKIPILDLHFRFYPIVFSLSLGVGTYFLASTFFKNRWALVFSLYFVYFAGSFGWIVDYIKNRSFGGESAFWANQSISFNLNPPFAISLLIIIALLLILKNQKLNFKEVLITVVLAGSLVGFKAYGAVLILSTLFIIMMLNLLKKDFSYINVLFPALILTALLFFPNFKPNQQLIIFSPFWFIHSMIDSADRVGWVRLSLARAAGLERENLFKFISAETIGLLLFILGNLGFRFLGILSLFRMKQILKNTYFLFLLIFSLLSFLIPVIFIQSGNPWNTIQFSYYGLYLAAVTSGVVLAYLISKLSRMLAVILLGVVVVLTPVNSITTASYYTGDQPHAKIDHEELQALKFLSKQEQGTVLTFPFDEKMQRKIAEPWSLFVYASSAYVSALSGKAVYLEDESQNQILLTDYKKRLVASKYFFIKPEAKFLNENNIEYIYLPKVFNIRVDGEFIENIFDNEEVVIYKVR